MQSNRPEIDKDIYIHRDSNTSVFFSSNLEFYIDKRCKCVSFLSSQRHDRINVLGTVLAGIHDVCQHVLPAILFEY